MIYYFINGGARMSQEQVEILKMVADRVITAEEGERLLRALEEGEAKRRDHSSEQRHRHGRGFRPLAGAKLGDLLSDLGGVVQDAVEEALGEVGGDFDGDDERYEEVALTAGRLALPERTLLLVRHRPFHGLAHGLGAGDGDVELVGTDGDTLVVSASEQTGLRVLRGKGRVALSFARGPVKLEVPASVDGLKVLTTTGSIRAERLGCAAELRTMGGNIACAQVSQSLKARSMGGGLRFELLPAMKGELRAATMGGDIEARLLEGIAAEVRCTAVGEIDIDPALGSSRRGADFPFGKAVFEIGGAAGAKSASVRLKSLGGKIRVSR
jgi:hypothetical protein